MKKRAVNLLKFKYPKIIGLLIAIIISYVLFKSTYVNSFVSHLGSLSYLGVFIAGMLFAFGFTAPFAVGFFITLNPQNILLVGILGGIGALLSDLFIFSFVRISFKEEFYRFKETKLIKNIAFQIERSLGRKIKVYLLYAFCGIIIASPLPDEIGVIMLAGLTKIKPCILAILSFMLNTLGIIILLNL